MNPSDDEIRDLLRRTKTIAVVGLSDKAHRASRGVSAYMQRNGYRIIPVNPNVEEVLGERAYASLDAVPEPFELINVFRRPRFVADLVEPASASGAEGFWTQLGVRDDAAAERLAEGGMTVVQDRCLMQEHMRLLL